MTDLLALARIPLVDVAGALALGNQLVQEAPKPLPAELRAPLRKLRDAVQVLADAHQGALAPRGKDTARTRLADQAVDRAWGYVEQRLAPVAALAAPEQATARPLYDTLFGEGLAFLTLPYAEQWAESERRVKLILGDRALVEGLVGPRFVEHLLTCHAEYGDAQGITAPKATETPAVPLAEPLQAFRAAAGAWARQIIARVDDDDDATLAAATAALAPLTNLREKNRREGKADPTPTNSPE
jgi:hypothetical protein